MKKLIIFAALIMAAGLFLLSGCARGAAQEARVKDFAALDMPYDNGTGVFLKWRPLDKSQRIIQYNIYRGHTPDSLFMLSKIEVDPTVGVTSEWVNFYDKDYIPLFEFETAPAKLSKEKHQTASGTLYKPVPRDPRVVGALLPYYDILGDINSPRYYKSSRRVELKGKDAPEVYAGYKLTQFNNLYANPKAENTYYYCVVPVSETGKFLPATPVLAATPVNNRPDSTAVFYATYLRDKQEFRFEWSAPLGSSDIYAWQAWLMPKSLLPQFHADQRANAASPDSVFNARWQNGSILLKEMSPAYWSQVFYDKVSFPGAPPDLENYVPVLAYSDYWQSADGSRVQSYTAAALGDPLSVHTSADLPILPDYQVLDKENDKGDNLVVSFGKPFAFVTQASFENKAKTRLRVNYEISGNGYEEIEKIRFDFFDQTGKSLGGLIENYPDKIVHFKLPSGFKPGENFSVKAFAKILGDKEYQTDGIDQRIAWDPSALRYAGGDATLRGQVLNEIHYDVFKKNLLTSVYSPAMRVGALSRAFDHAIPYPSTEMPSILKYDPKTGLLLTDHHFTVALDEKGQVTFSPSLYKKDFSDYLGKLKKEIADLQAKVAPTDTLSEDAQALKAKLAEQKFILADPGYKLASAATSNKAWVKLLRSELDKNSRSYSYKLLATNGKGLWSDGEDFPAIAKVEANPKILYPKGEWFDRTKLATLIATIVMGILVAFALYLARRKDLYIRPIAGLQELDNAVGRATEMGRPVMFVPGWGTLGDPCTISAMMILNQIGKKTAEYDIRLIMPNVDYLVLPVAQEMVQSAYNEMGRPDAYNQNDIFFVSDTQFAFCAAVNGITVRERIATIFYMGYFYAEALLMTETGNQSGAIQIAASDAITQIPFFITTCDYTLIGEEFYAASAYLSRNVELVSMLKAQDYFKVIIIVAVVVGTVLSTLHINALLNFLPFE